MKTKHSESINDCFPLKTKVCLLTILVILSLCLSVKGQQSSSNFNRDNDVHKWVEQHFAKGKVPPFSFVYGGKSSDNFIKNWQYSAEKIKSTDPNVEETVYTYSDKQSGLVVKCFGYLF